jgi:photosystem II stability/assembly factor-like uncharacterized protein
VVNGPRVVVAILCVSACGAGHAGSAPASHQAARSPSAQSSRDTSRRPLVVSMDGKYVDSAPAPLGARHLLLAMGGFAFRGKEPFSTWMERSSNGGRTWQPTGWVPHNSTVASAQDSLDFVDRRDGWAFGPGLWWTTDGGKSWHSQHVDPAVDADHLVAVGHSAWLDLRRCRARRCTDRIESIAQPGAALRPIGGHPAGGTVDDLVRPTTTVAYAVTAEFRPGARRPGWTLSASGDSGQHWATRSLPCSTENEGQPTLAASTPTHLWLICQQEIGMMDDSSTVYRSSDGGRTWALKSATLDANAARIVQSLSSLIPTSDRDAWATSSNNQAQVYVLRTTDGGRHFSVVFGDERATDLGGFTVLSTTAAIVSGFQLTDAGRREVIYRTHDAGRTWRLSTLRAPRGVPTRRTAAP